ncbi:TetR/AcrR family transcriptional regulator [Paralcaligenes ginsengisoli]
MPRVSREQTQKNRAVIENVSARLFREQGFNGVSVADLMAAAGLTHGGFYGHFSSKDELTDVACAAAFKQSSQRRNERSNKHADPRHALHAHVDHYLSTWHRDHTGNGCPAVALAGDVAREPADKPVHRTYAAGVEGMADSLTTLFEASGAPQPRSQALATLATLVGAQVLARATRGSPLSDDILAAAREFLLDVNMLNN